MGFGVRVTVPPTEEPLSLAEARAQCNIDSSDQDGLLAIYILAARTHAEDVTGRCFCTTRLSLTLDEWPCEAIVLPRGPVSGVTSITYTDQNGAAQVWGAGNYRVDLSRDPARITPAYDVTWPPVRVQMAAIAVVFDAGYGTPDSLPEPIRLAMMLLVGHYYENREAVNVGNIVTPLPMAVEALLSPYRMPML